MTYFTADTPKEFEYNIEYLMRNMLEGGDQPMVITSSAATRARSKPRMLTLLFSRVIARREYIASICASYRIKKEDAAELVASLNQRLLDAGKLVGAPDLEGWTHIISLERVEHDKEPFRQDYYVKMDDIDATLTAIKIGGRLRKNPLG